MATPDDDIRVTATQIRRALSDVGMTEADPWLWGTYYHTPAGTGSRHGLLVAAGHIVGQQKPRLLDVTTAQTWEERLEGFRFELVGRIITQQDLEAEPCPFWGLHVPNPGDYDLFDAAGLLRVAVWRWRAIHVEAPVFAQVDWRPGWDDEERSYGGVRVGAPNDTTRAELGLAIIQQHQLEEATRQRRRWATLAAVTVDMMVARFLELERRDGRRPSQDALVDSYGVARSALTRWLEDHALTWSEFLAKLPSRC